MAMNGKPNSGKAMPMRPICDAPIAPDASTVHISENAVVLVTSVLQTSAGRMIFTDTGLGQLLVLDKPGGTPRVLSSKVPVGGGIAIAGKYAYVGTGNSAANAQNPDLRGAGILRVDLKTGKTTTFATGLAMANGLVRTAKGVFYGSNDFKPAMDKVSATGKVTSYWQRFDANGLALGAKDRYLYANRSLNPTQTVRVDLKHPAKVTTVAAAQGADANAFLDGLTLGKGDRPYAVTFGAGQVWRADLKGGYCALASGLTFPTTLAFGKKGKGFDTHSLYVGTAKGLILRIPKAA